MESICKRILTFHKVLVESLWAFLQELTHNGKLMETYFHIQYGEPLENYLLIMINKNLRLNHGSFSV